MARTQIYANINETSKIRSFRTICPLESSDSTNKIERNKNGNVIRRLQYMLLFATIISFVYFLVILTMVERPELAHLRWAKKLLTNHSKRLAIRPRLQRWNKELFFNAKRKRNVVELGRQSKINYTLHTPSTTEQPYSEITGTGKERLQDRKFINNQLIDLNSSTEKIEHFVPRYLRKIDWHNYQLIENEKQRRGLGEQGKPAIRATGIQRTFEVGFDEELSDKISLNRSIPDLRHRKCLKKLYIASLPPTSVVIPFYDEHLNTLLRTIHSVINRSPPQVLMEVLVIDDGNDRWAQRDKFYRYVAEHLPKVKIITLPRRSGLMAARTAGVQAAKGDAVVVLDSHTEVNVNWLPPLLEPIALNYRTVVLPLIDVIEPSNFHYRGQHDAGRGVFDWELGYFRSPLLPRDRRRLPEPYETPVMTGGLFAISRAFFLELGGYDPGLMTWAGEQYELSFKVWQCGGSMLEAPCSRVGHLYRIHGYSGGDAARNLRRVAEVWMDEYAQYVYQRMPGLLRVDPGDLSQQRTLRKRLHCKPFRWYMDQVAFDIPNRFPMVVPAPFAQGRIRPMDQSEFCADAGNGTNGDTVQLKKCGNDSQQSFFFSWEKDLRLNGTKFCWAVPDASVVENAILVRACDNTLPQRWRYDPDSKWITFGGYDSLCLTKHRTSLFLDHCLDEGMSQKWLVDQVDYERVARWEITTKPVTGPKGDWPD